jgi:5'(3')-deoxyribonucleotidase
MRPTRIILDIDDVLNTLSMHIMQHFGCHVGPWDYYLYPTDIGYDVVQASRRLGGNPLVADSWDNVTIPDFWKEVTNADLWRTAPKSPQCDYLIKLAADLVGQEQVLLATTPTKCPVSHGHKLEWIWDNLPQWIHRQYFLTPRKWCLGKPGVVLIDDNNENCRLFEEEGGTAILLPRPWNNRNHLDTDDLLVSELNSLFS